MDGLQQASPTLSSRNVLAAHASGGFATRSLRTKLQAKPHKTLPSTVCVYAHNRNASERMRLASTSTSCALETPTCSSFTVHPFAEIFSDPCKRAPDLIFTDLNGDGDQKSRPWYNVNGKLRFYAQELYGEVQNIAFSADGNFVKDAYQVALRESDGEDIGAEHGEGFETFRPGGPLKVDVDYLNDRMREKGLQRIRYAMKPDEAFGLIYSWDNVLADTRALKLDAWRQLALEEGKVMGDDKETEKHILSMGTENVLRKILGWVDASSSVDSLKARLGKIYYEKLSKVRAPREGLKEWLEALATAGVPCAVASSLDRFNLLAALQRMGLYKYFQAVVTQEDGMDSMAHRFLSAAVKLDRPPSKCVVFEDDPRGIAAAHNCSMKAVALIGSHPAYELTQADLAVGSFSELSVINLRRLFANKGAEFMDLQKQRAEKKPPKRRTATDTAL